MEELRSKCEEMKAYLSEVNATCTEGGVIKDCKLGNLYHTTMAAMISLDHIIRTVDAYFTD